MYKTSHLGVYSWLSVILSLLIAISGIAGIFFEEQVYALNNPYYIAQIIGQDMVNLGLLIPLLLISVFFMRRNSRKAVFVWLGTVIYAFYIFAAYGFSLHYNNLFLVYCYAYGISFYVLVFALVTTDAESIQNGFSQHTKTKPVVTFLTVMGALISAVWLSEPIPSTITGALPAVSVLNGHITSPFHLLDLGLFFPAFFVSAYLLYKKQPFGYLLAPAILVFIVIMCSTLIVEIFMLALRGYRFEWDSMVIFVPILVIGSLVLARFLRWCTNGETG